MPFRRSLDFLLRHCDAAPCPSAPPPPPACRSCARRPSPSRTSRSMSPISYPRHRQQGHRCDDPRLCPAEPSADFKGFNTPEHAPNRRERQYHARDRVIRSGATISKMFAVVFSSEIPTPMAPIPSQRLGRPSTSSLPDGAQVFLPEIVDGARGLAAGQPAWRLPILITTIASGAELTRVRPRHDQDGHRAHRRQFQGLHLAAGARLHLLFPGLSGRVLRRRPAGIRAAARQAEGRHPPRLARAGAIVLRLQARAATESKKRSCADAALALRLDDRQVAGDLSGRDPQRL